MAVGVFTTQQLTKDLTAKSFAAMIMRLMPNGSAPLFGLSGMLSDETAKQVEHGYFSKTMIFPSLQLTAAGATAVADTLLVVSTINVIPGMMFRVDTTGENILVNAVLGTTQISVQRAVGNIAATAIGANAVMFMVGNASEEASLRPSALSINAVRITNLTQIFRNTWAVSGTIRATQVIAGDATVAENKTDCAAFHAVDIEKALIFGQKFYGYRNGQPFHTMDGFISTIGQFASGNITTFAAPITWAALNNALDIVFNVTSDPKIANERVLFVGGTALQVINEVCRRNGNYQLMDGQTSFGLQFRTLRTSRGSFRIIEHPLLNAYGPTSSWARMALAVDLTTFKLAYLEGRKTDNLEFNTQGNQAQDNGIDAVGGTLTTELTNLIKNPAANAILYNFVSAA
jgi:hypothetical protein